MPLLDLILNLVGMLLWLSWRSMRFDPLVKSTPASLVGTLKRAEPRSFGRWRLLAALVLLLGLRGLVYWWIGGPVEWTPKLNLGFVVLAFRNEWKPVMLYSLLSFCRFFVIVYFWLLVLVLINRRVVEPDPIQKLLRLHLGRLGRWPWPILVLLPLVGIAAVWLSLHPVLWRLNVVTPTASVPRLLEQGAVICVALVLSLKYLLAGLLVVYLIANYVYLGPGTVWGFISTTAGNTLKPLSLVPLKIAKLDLAPVVGITLLLVLLEWLPGLMEKQLGGLWPQ